MSEKIWIRVPLVSRGAACANVSVGDDYKLAEEYVVDLVGEDGKVDVIGEEELRALLQAGDAMRENYEALHANTASQEEFSMGLQSVDAWGAALEKLKGIL